MPYHTGDDGFNSVGFSPDGKFLYVGNDAGIVRLYENFDDFHPNSNSLSTFDANRITSIATTNQYWLSTSTDGILRRYNQFSDSSPEHIWSSSLAATCVATSSTGGWVAVASEGPDIMLVNLYDIQETKKLQGHRGNVRKLSWHPHKNLLASCGADGKLLVWDTAAHKSEPLTDVAMLLPSIADHESLAYKYDCSAVWHPSGDCFFVATSTRTIVKVDSSSWKSTTLFIPPQNPVTALAVSPNGAYLAIASNHQVSILDVVKKNVIATHTNPDEDPSKKPCITQIAFQPNANALVWVTTIGTFTRLTDVVPGKYPSPFEKIQVREPEPPVQDEVADLLQKIDAANVVDNEEEQNEVEDEEKGDDTGDVSDAEDGPSLVQVTSLQEQFQPGETPLSQNKKYLTINKIGYIERTEVPGLDSSMESHHIIDVKFFDESKRRRIHFTDEVGYTLGYLGERGVLLAANSKIETEPAQVLFRPYLDMNASEEWTYQLNPGCSIVGIASGALAPRGSTKNMFDSDLDGFGDVVIATSDSALVFLSGTGRERRILGMGGQFVSMVASHEWVFVVHGPASSVDGSQNLSYTLINFEDFSVRQRDLLPLGENVQLKWIGITEEGAPAIFDTVGRIHVLTKYRIPHHASWARIFDSEMLERKQGKHESYWPIAIFGSTLLCVILKGNDTHPSHPLPPPQELPIEMPFTSENKAEEKVAREHLLLEILRDGLDDQLTNDEIVKTEQNMDKDLVLLIQSACKLSQIPRAIELAKLIHNARFLDAVLKIAQFYRFEGLEEKIRALKAIREAEEDQRLIIAREKRAQWTRPDPLVRGLADVSYAAPQTKTFQHSEPPPTISRPGLALAVPVKETTRFPASSSSMPPPPLPSDSTSSENKRKRDEVDDFASSQDSVLPPPKQKVNPFARKNGVDTNRNPFGVKGGANRTTIQKSDSFFDKVETAEDAPKSTAKRGPKPKDKKKEGPKQTTLFGMMMDKKEKARVADSETQDSDVSMSDFSVVADESQPELPEEWEETQPVDMVETQPVMQES